uniref:Prohibitin n=1 Tax=Meloidogyne hapla TaxID=6305 RepID=A0A1I8BBE5_MELHA
MPVIASKVQDLVENLSGREIRFSTAVPLLLYILDIIMISIKRRVVVTFELKGTQKERTAFPEQIRSSLAALKAIFQVFQNRKNRQIPFLTEKALQAVVLFIKENQNFSIELLDDVLMIKEILDRQQHVLSQMDKEILKREISKMTNVESL